MSEFTQSLNIFEINDEKKGHICHICSLSSHVKHVFETCQHGSCSPCLTNCRQLGRDKSLLVWKQFSICIICPVHGAFDQRNPALSLTHTQRTIKRKESERQTGTSDGSGEWQRSPHKAKVNSFASPSITEQLREVNFSSNTT